MISKIAPGVISSVFLVALLYAKIVQPAFAQACQTVGHPKLEALLPAIPGFTRGMPNGDTDNQEAVSRTTVDYESPGGAGTISVELMDTCRNPNMLSQFREYLKVGPPPTPGTTFRSVAVKGFPAYEEWTAVSQHTEIHILVADRFAVKLTGDFVNLPTVQNAAQTIDLQKLAALK